MPVERVFLGWDRPALTAAAHWLRTHTADHPDNDPFLWDLSAWIIAVPGARAGRRLREVLVEHAGDRGLSPPQITTVGRLPEMLYWPPGPLASPLVATLARAAALRSATADELLPLIPRPPRPDDHHAWLRLADELARLDADLAAAALTPAHVAPRLAAALPEFDDQSRWQALASLHDRYLALLDAHHLNDRDAARAAALSGGRCTCPRPIALLAVADLSPQIAAMLRQAAARGTRVIAFIHAPAQEENAFDDLGVLRTDHWTQRPIALGDGQWRVVDRPRDQAAAVLDVLRDLGKTSNSAHTGGASGGASGGTSGGVSGGTSGGFAADQITVGVGDPALAQPIVRTLQLAGLPARTPTSDTQGRRPGRTTSLLSALAGFLDRHRFDDLAGLLRHPDAEHHLVRTLGRQPAARGIASWLSLLDRYANDHLQGRLTDDWLGDPDTRRRLKALYDAVLALLPQAAAPRPLPHWAQPILDVLATVYAGRELSRFDPTDRTLIAELTVLRDALAQVAALDPGHDYVPTLTAAQAVATLLSLLDESPAPLDSGDPAIEVLGWLELQLDDAPCLIVTGFNEGLIPQSTTAHALLPDRARGILGLTDNRRRLARDAAALTAILASRPGVTLIAGRRDADDNPLTPSRLLLACGEDELPTRIRRFYEHNSAGPTAPQSTPDNNDHDDASAFLIPPPSLIAATLGQAPPILTKLRVTAFRDYLACPYRFFLRHVLKLEALDDARVEMGGDAFGTLAHAVLDAFGRDADAARQTKAAHVIQRLDELLDGCVAARFGANPAAAVALQREQLRYRLHRFALWHVRQVSQGWSILCAERSLEATLDVDGDPFTLTGKIDRIDRHENGTLRILDYKSADAPRSPEEVHRSGRKDDKTWRDLQLPLYRTLARQSDLAIQGPVELGYILLPKDPSRVGLSAAEWNDDELDDAQARAKEVIRAIRAGRFWRPADAPRYADELSGLCMDGFPQRGAALRAGEAHPSPFSGGLEAPRSTNTKSATNAANSGGSP